MVSILVTDFHKLSSGQTILIGQTTPKKHKIITSNCKAIMTVGNETPTSINLLGEDINVKKINTSLNDQTFLRTLDNLDKELNYLGEKEIIITIE